MYLMAPKSVFKIENYEKNNKNGRFRFKIGTI